MNTPIPVHTPKSILITGGTGSFGQAFVRHLLNTPSKIERICIFSRGEHAQAALRDAIGDNPLVRYMVGDIRDSQRLTRACSGVDTIIHAAALKRIEVGAYNPDEMVKTNVLGTMNVIEAAHVAGVKRVVGLSTDKAYQPVSPYGQSKALAESLMLAANSMYGSRGPRFAVTRYGNIWNAQGSVVPKWNDCVVNGKPITLTNPNCTRFYMTIDEAIQMVWGLAKNYKADLVIPDWLPAYRIGDLAMLYRDRYLADVVITGLPAFEKLHESMNAELCSENARRMTMRELAELLP